MFNQKSTETVTLTRPQLQAILEIISQIGGMSRSSSDPNVNPRNYRNDNKLMFSDISDTPSQNNKSLKTNNQWERQNEELLSTSDWVNNIEHNGRASSLIMLSDNSVNNLLLSPNSSDSSKVGDLRVDSVMTNESCSETSHRRYARTNDSEFDWNAFHRKRMKALEYSRALALQNQEKQKSKLDEQHRRRVEDQRLDQKIEEQRIRMRNDFEREQKIIQQKRLSTEMKREAVIAAIERTPIIKKRNFLVDSPTDPQPVAAIKPQTITKEMSAQTDEESVSPQHCDTGTQTDVQLLLYLLNEMNLLSKQKQKPLIKSEEIHSNNSTFVSKSLPINKPKKTKSIDKQEKTGTNRGLWVKKQNIKSNLKNEIKSQENGDKVEDKEKESEIQLKSEKSNNSLNNIEETEQKSKSFRRRSFNISSSVENLSLFKNQRVMSSIDIKKKNHFLPQISARPHSRKKWYSQERFDPNILT